MFSIGAGCCCGSFDEIPVYGEYGCKTTGVSPEKLNKFLIKDCVLAIIFGVLAILGFSGVLSLAVGITFCVLGVVQLALAACMKTCVTVRDQ
jgi:hypothetical protein